MIRFQPDTWYDGLLRPFLMLDPSAGLYYEEGAPDLRFAALVIATGGVLLSTRWRHQVSVVVRVGLLAMIVLFYGWVFAIGNGRYFMPGLLLAGPLFVAVWWAFPGTKSFRWVLLLGFLGLQIFVVSSMYRPGAWGLVRWHEGPAVALEDSPLRHRPLTVVTITSISYSVLVPWFHPQSRWVNIAGQVSITPKILEHSRVRDLLASPLPVYLLIPAHHGADSKQLLSAPDGATWAVIDQTLTEHGLAARDRQCVTLRSNLLPHGIQDPLKPKPAGGFWLCPLVLSSMQLSSGVRDDPHAPVFAKLETICPRYFKPGEAETRHYDGFWQRYYLGSDMRLIVDGSGNVLYRYFRHFTPVRIANVSEVIAPEWSMNCTRLKGRYRPPWVADE